MLNHQTILRCSQSTAFVLFFLLGSFFLLAGCAQMYRAIGMDEEQVTTQVQKDQTVITKILDTTRATTTEIILTALSGLGAILSGFLAKWLGTERKITKALITGIEDAEQTSVKGHVRDSATQLGVQQILEKRVRSLT